MHASIPNSSVLALTLLLGVPALAQDPKPAQPVKPAGAAMPALAIRPAPGQPSNAQKGVPTLQPGAPAPDFTSKDANGKDVKLSDFKDKVVVIDFWATWCQPCQQAMPHVQELAKEFADQGVVVLAVCTSDNQAKFDEWMPKNRAKYPNVIFAMDPNERGSKTFDDRASQKLFHVEGLPTKFVVGRDGKIKGTVVGYDPGDVRIEVGLAEAGIKIDPAIVEQGKKQIAKQVAEEAQRAAMRAANPAPKFMIRIGKHASGDALPDFTMEGPDGKTFPLSSFKGKPIAMVFGWPGMFQIEELNALHERHARYGVLTLALNAFAAREDYKAWVEKNAGEIKFATAFDPAGKYVPEGDNPDPKGQMAWLGKTIVSQMSGGPNYGTPAMPVIVVIDGEGRYIGHCMARGDNHDGLANLLLKAGAKLEGADLPAEIAPPSAFVPKPPEPKVEMIKVGSVAPDFAMQDLAGKTVKLADFKDKVIVLDFWATWCGPCKEALPHVQEIAAHYKEQGVVVIASCTSDSRSAFEGWVEKNRAEYADILFAHDALEKGLDRASRKLYGVSGIPAQFVIGRDGKIAAFVGGYMKGEKLLDAALAKAGITVDAATLEKAAQDQKKRDANR